ncbi:MAG: short-chain dehydrogenase/reductase [Sulfobacillus acidophilus]|uniref:Short-chain dehydrogenase/reductase n=1 Tax=Sulfobacillus acidophilus TaxID=53633 RepID=A0A2T2WGW1_9FIRM|nr:MAG: short-chain dehydrogenase/reductase [Sulfobacillus acidophilus]
MKIALITGSSSGIGMATALEMAQRGYHVIATMRHLERGTSLVAKAQQLGVMDRLQLAQLDVTAPYEHVAEIIRDLLSKSGPVDVLVNNAGIGILGPVETLPEKAWRKVMDTNFFGALAVMQAILPYMRERRQGMIVNVSSVSGRAASAGFGAYAAAKFALEAASEALRSEMLPYHVDMVLIEPGNYRTAITEHEYPADLHNADVARALYPEVMEGVEEFLNYHRTIADDPVEVARVIANITENAQPPLRVPVGRVGEVSAQEWIRRRLRESWPSMEGE